MSAPALGLQSLAALAHVLSQSHELHDLIEQAAEHSCDALAAASVSISRIEPDADVIRTLINVGDLAPHEERWPADEVYPIAGDERLTSAMRDRKSWVDSIASDDCADQERALLETLGKGCALVTAIVVDGSTWGEFYATRHVDAPVFDEDAVAYAEVLAAILGAAISGSIREAALERLARRDPLTGLLNRRALDEQAEAIFDLGADTSRPVAIVALDINGLKHVNDTEGHASGDQQICNVAMALTSAFLPFESSVVARVGGDEFTVMVSGPEVQSVVETVNGVCRAVRRTSSTISVSAGVACGVLTPTSSLTMGALFAAADRGQYVAKRSRSPIAFVTSDVKV